MVGIYKITNKLTGKSYIGQSIHCGKRLDEHCKGKSQFIDQMIEFDGIDQYTFEIIKEVKKEELSYWEDYYIIMYNAMYPNGYNKKWNTSEEIRSMMNVTPLNTIPKQDNIVPAQETSNGLTKPELKQLEWWQEFIWKYEHDKLEFIRPYATKKEIEEREKELKRLGIELVSLEMKDIIRYAPRTEEEYKKLKQEVEFKNSHYPHINYVLPLTSSQLSHQSGATPARKKKYTSLKKDIETVNNKRIKYKINNYGAICANNNLNVATIDYKNNCLKIEMETNRSSTTISWGFMFEEGLLPKENVKIINRNNEFVDFSWLKDKPKEVDAILFF